MKAEAAWDWEPGTRTIQEIATCDNEYQWREEPVVSPDGESLACVVNLEQGVFGLCVNGRVWETTFEKIWYPRFAPDNRLTAIVSQDGEWTLAVDGETWPEFYGFLWNTTFSESGAIAAAVQKDMTYGMAVDGALWDQLYENANHFTFSPNGKATAAVVQNAELGEADIEHFQEGLYTAVVNGETWNRNFVNVWTPVFNRDGDRLAAVVRLNLYEHTIAVDGKPWSQTYNAVWEPAFNPATGAVVAPVRQGGAWGLAKDGALLWPAHYSQLWHQKISRDGKHIAAIAAVKFGRFTVTVNDHAWTNQFSVVTDLAQSPDGSRAAAIGKENDVWSVIVDDTRWSGRYERAWGPVFSPDGRHAAAKVEKNGRYTIAVNNKEYPEDFEAVWNPIFSPDSEKILIRAVKDGKLIRIVAKVADV